MIDTKQIINEIISLRNNVEMFRFGYARPDQDIILVGLCDDLTKFAVSLELSNNPNEENHDEIHANSR